MEFKRAERHLELLDEARHQDSAPEGELAKSLTSTLIPDESGQEVFLSTQIQAQMDELDRQQDVRRSLTRFALQASPETQHTATDSAQQEGTKRRPLKRAKGQKDTRRPTRKRTATKIKSITQFNTDNFESEQQLSRAERVVSLLSGKKRKVKDILGRLKRQDAHEPSISRFATYDEREWQHILQLLQANFQQCPRAQMREVRDYVYGSGPDIWCSSQLPPTQQEQKESIDMASSLPANVPSLSVPVADSLVFSLSQVMDVKQARNRAAPSEDEKARSEISNSSMDLGSRIGIDDHRDEGISAEKLESLGSGSMLHADLEAVLDTHLSPSFDESVHTHSTQSHPPSVDLNTFQNNKSPLIPATFGDNLIDLTQDSFAVVKSLISPLETDVQVPATRTTTLNAGCGAERRLIFRNIGRSVNFKDPALQKSLELRFLDSDHAVLDSEEEDGYELLEIRPRPVPVQRLATASAAKLVQSGVFETPPAKITSLDDSTLMSTSAHELRSSLRKMGFKPKRTRLEMVKQMQQLSQHLKGNSNEERREEIYDQLLSTIEQLPDFFARIYTYEPIPLSELVRVLVKENPFMDDIEDVVVRDWAERMGISLTAAPE
ncbi:LAMI_0H17018g1_1 [Lachancea mirantina]|uniref:Structure-specific endonuclease subunit SLX4 n=1 Tax=Lachancea mirantina TaxID=1230905 RepID=A0A1G4KJ09_9SACH|nr:LAMI_0H17018g1_1 [Lachancea mirantina]